MATVVFWGSSKHCLFVEYWKNLPNVGFSVLDGLNLASSSDC